MGAFILDSLDCESMGEWLERARRLHPEDPLEALIASWIAFYCYYSAFAEEYKPDYIVWANDPPGRKGLKPRWRFLINHAAFRKFFDSYREKRPAVSVADNPPKTGARTEDGNRLVEMDAERLFLTLYRLRNSLIQEGGADSLLFGPAGDFMLSFLGELLRNTTRSTSKPQPSN